MRVRDRVERAEQDREREDPDAQRDPGAYESKRERPGPAHDVARDHRRRDAGHVVEEVGDPGQRPPAPVGAIRAGKVQQTGTAMDNPLRESEIQTIAQTASWVNTAPTTLMPSSIPNTSTVFRTRTSFPPRRISQSTSQPPTTSSAIVPQSHGMAA